MKKAFLLTFSLSTLFANVHYGQNIKKHYITERPVKILTDVQKSIKIARLELKSIQSGQTPDQSKSSEIPQANSIQNSSITYTNLGRSINPYTSIGAGRNYLSVNNSLNTIALFRRGSVDEMPLAQKPGNNLYLDINTKAGATDQWQKKRNKLLDGNGGNSPARYPQGVLWNPLGNIDTINAFAYGMVQLLDASNTAEPEGWGGIGRSWIGLENGASAKQTHWSSQTGPYLHSFLGGMELTSSGAIFAIEPENNLTQADPAFMERVMIYKYTYNSNTETFDSSVTTISFSNTFQSIPTTVNSSQIAFGPDGQTGYAVISAFNPDFETTLAFIPYYSMTTNGGDSWSEFKIINFNKTEPEKPYRSLEKDSLRAQLLGNYVIFHADGSFSEADSSLQNFSHPVDYTMLQMDLTVDKNNFAHIFTTLVCTGSFGDTLQNDDIGFIARGLGSWQVDIFIHPVSGLGRGVLINTNQSLEGRWGNLSNTNDRLDEFNRPSVSRSDDGSIIAFSWSETDIVKYPPSSTAFNNRNPDLWLRGMRVAGPQDFKLYAKSRNMTNGSQYDGNATLATAAPILINKTSGFQLAASTAIITSGIPPDPAVWPIQHLFVNGINLPPASSDTAYTEPVGGLLILKKKEIKTTKINTNGIKLYPNPGTGYFSANLSVKKQGIAHINIYNALGQIVENKKLLLPEGESNIPFNLSKNEPGIFSITIELNGEVLSSKFIKK